MTFIGSKIVQKKIADFEHPTRRDTDASVIRNFVPVFCNGRLRGYGETP